MLNVSGQVCVPRAAREVARARQYRENRKIGSLSAGCSCSAPMPTKATKCYVPCDPDTMRARVEAKLQSLGLYPAGRRLSLNVYTMARNIHSEAGNSATAAEKLAMGEALVSRARESGKTFSQIAMYNGRYYGAQIGTNPAVATAADPYWEDIVAATLVVSGQSGNFSRGATHYFSPGAQDRLYARGVVSKNRYKVYDTWTSRDRLSWVGYVPGIKFERQMLFRRLPETPAGLALRAKMLPLGRQALSLVEPPGIVDAPTCSGFSGAWGAVALSSTAVLALALPAYLVLRYGRG